MGFFSSYRQERAGLTGPESVDTLSHMETFFRDGSKWTRDVYERADGARCLVGAANHVRVSPIDDAKHWLREAIAEQTSGEITTIERFNDTRQNYGEIAAVIERAKELATLARLPAPARRFALPAPAATQVPAVIDMMPVPVALPSRPAPVTIDMEPIAPQPVRARREPRPSLAEWFLND